MRPTPLALEGDFGRAVLTPQTPAISELRLRRKDGTFEPQQLLSPTGFPWLRGVADWGTQAYTYVVDAAGKRYESRFVPAQAVTASTRSIKLQGVQLVAAAGEAPVARENWRIERSGAHLRWTVERTWLRDFDCRLAGTPALFFSHRPYNPNPSTILPNSTATTLWVNPKNLQAKFEPLYRPAAFTDVYKISRNNAIWLTRRDASAVAKLWTSWPHQRDLFLQAENGFLYRRGFFGWQGELGANAGVSWPRRFHAGETETVTLILAPSEAAQSGHQMAVNIPDKTTQNTLTSFYGSLFNGGVINDAFNYNFGNEVDGWSYAGASWMKGFALQAGVPMRGSLGSDPYPLPQAFRDNLAQIMATVSPEGKSSFGYNFTGTYIDDNLHTIIGTCAYLNYSGDVAFAKRHLPVLEKMIGYFLARRNADRLFDGGDPQHWYYDAQPSSGVNTYHNTFLFKALTDLAQICRASGEDEKAKKYDAIAAEIKNAINRVLWFPDAPGGARYCDWITPSGEKVSYAADICQWPPLALGIASPQQARQLIQTLDRRIETLKRENGYTEYASVSAYWPVPPHINTHPANQGFGNYMNGGSFLAQTYWEIVGRARNGDSNGAWRRLKKFTEGSRSDGWGGNNWINMKGEIGYGAADEPYLSDMVVVPAALIQGILGICPTWDSLNVAPDLPDDWKEASADIMWKGKRYRVRIKGKNVEVRPLISVKSRGS